MSQKFYGPISLLTQSSINLFDSASSNSISIRAPATVTTSGTLTLPNGVGANGQVMVTDGLGVLSWSYVLSASLAANNIYIGNGSNSGVATNTSSLGDVLASSATGLTVKNGVISNTHVASGAAIAVNKLAALTAAKAVATDGSGVLTASSTTSTELGYLAGVTSSIQTQLGNKVDTSAVGAANGVASLDSAGKIPLAQIPASLVEYQGTWDAGANNPSLANGTGTAGYYYRVNNAGTKDLGEWFHNSSASVSSGSNIVTVTATNHGLASLSKINVTTSASIGNISGANLSVSNATVTVINANTFTYLAGASATSSASGTITSINVIQTFAVGDWVIYNGAVWQLAHAGADVITSVNGQTGVVSLTTTDIPQGTNLYYTDAAARAAISATSPITYSSSTGVIGLGTVTVSNGGTGVTTLTTNGVVYGNGSSSVGVTSAGAQYQVLVAGPTGVPGFGQVNLAQNAAIVGTLSISNGGTGQTTKAPAFDALSPMSATGDIIIGGASGTGTRLAAGSTGNVLTISGGSPVWAPVPSVVTTAKTTWVTADGTSKTWSHGLNSTDVLVQVFDITDGSTIEVEVFRTSTAVLTLVSSAAPGASGWRILAIAI